ncbi:MAG: response regulator [Myxococcota bacterium]
MSFNNRSRAELIALIHDLQAQLDASRSARISTVGDVQREMAHRERLEVEARQREARLTAVLETVVSGIITIDTSGLIITFNPAAERMFGYAANEVIGHNVRVLMPEPYCTQHDAYLDRFLTTGKRNVIGIGREVRGRRKDGTTFPLDLGISETIDEDGTRWFTGVLHDITERKKAEARLLQTEEALRRIHEAVSQPELNLSQRLEALLQLGCDHFNLPYGVLTRFDGDTFEVIHATGEPLPNNIRAGARYTAANAAIARGLVTFYSPLRYLNLSKEQLGVLPCGSHHSVQDYVGLPVRVGQRPYGMLNFCGPTPREHALEPHDDEILKMLAQAVGSELWREEAIEALQESEKRFQQAQKLEAIGRLSSGIAHDFNNLIMGVTGCINAALKHLPKRAPSRMFLEEARHAAHQGASLTRQLLAFSRKQPDDPVKIDLNTVIVKNAQIFHSLLGEDIDLQIALKSNRAHIWCDEGKMEQILMNLVVNARDAMPQGGNLRITTRVISLAEEDRERTGLSIETAVCLKVEDTGIGMDEATLERVFEPFFTTKDMGKGTGLGLSTVYGIIRQIGGHVDLTSSPGEGTQFTFYLPPYVGQGHPREAPPLQERPLRYGHETVLLVEDDNLVRMSVRHFLEHWGYRVLEANDGHQGLQSYQAHASDIALLVTDTVLPRMSGAELAQHIHAENPTLPILYMSAHTQEMLRAEGRLQHNIEILQKPFKEEALIAAVSLLLGPHSEAQDRPPHPPPGSPLDTESSEPEAVSPAASFVRPTMLLIDDYAPVRNASKYLLEDEGFQVYAAGSGAEALRLAHEQQFDVVVTDINLPDIDGPEIIRRLRKDTPALGVIYLSGLSQTDPRVLDALQEPGTAFFEKPVDVEALAKKALTMLP